MWRKSSIVDPVILGQGNSARTLTCREPMPATLSDRFLHIQELHPQAIAMGLERVRDVVASMGIARPAPCVITPSGTNGKGSTVAFIEAVARTAGPRVGHNRLRSR